MRLIDADEFIKSLNDKPNIGLFKMAVELFPTAYDIDNVRAEAIYEAIKIADCSHTDCWDCAFGEADICKLQQLYGQLKEQNK